MSPGTSSTVSMPNCLARNSLNVSSLVNPNRTSSLAMLEVFSRSFFCASKSCSRETTPPFTIIPLSVVP